MRHRKNVILLLVNSLLLLCTIACLISFSALGNLLESQKVAARWAGDSDIRMAQVSAFLSKGEEIDLNEVYSFRSQLEKALTEASLEASEDGRLYADAYAAFGEITISSTKDTATVSAIGVGGDYFLFHPMFLRSGSFISESDFSKDLVVLDESLAWRLFGSNDIAGMQVKIGGESYVVSGVISRESDFASERAYTDGAGIYLSYEALIKNYETKISSYEIALPDPISGFAVSTVEKAFPIKDGVIVENSARFKLSKILSIVKHFGDLAIVDKAVIFPYWENAARIVETYMALVIVAGFICAILPAVSLMIVIVRLFKRLKKHSRRLKKTVADRWDDFSTKPKKKVYNIKGKEKVTSLPDNMTATVLPDIEEAVQPDELLFDIESIVREVMEQDKADI